MKRGHRVVFAMLVLAATPALYSFEGPQYPTVPSLESVVTAFAKDVSAADGEALVGVVRAFLPVKEDLQALLPKHAAQVDVGASGERFAAAVKKKLALALNADEAPKLVIINCRQEGEAEEYRGVLALLPKETPVFRAIWTDSKSRLVTELRSLVYVNKRWVLMPLLTALPQLLKKQDTQDAP
jgi:hypothetical protein